MNTITFIFPSDEGDVTIKCNIDARKNINWEIPKCSHQKKISSAMMYIMSHHQNELLEKINENKPIYFTHAIYDDFTPLDIY